MATTIKDEFVLWFIENQVASAIELVGVWAGDGMLDVHRSVLHEAQRTFVNSVQGVVGAIAANQDTELENNPG